MERRRVLLVVAVVVAVMGAALVFVYAQNAEERARAEVGAGSESRQVLVATQEIAPGESAADAAAAGKVVLEEVPGGRILDGAVSDGTALADQVALTTLYPGEQLVAQKFGSVEDVDATATLPLPEGKVATAVVLDDQSRISGFTNPGSRVGMLVTGTFPPSGQTETRLMLDRVQILATGTTTIGPQQTAEGEAAAETAQGPPLNQYVLALDPRDAARVRFAQSLGELSLVLLPPDSTLQIGDPITAANLFAAR